MEENERGGRDGGRERRGRGKRRKGRAGEGEKEAKERRRGMGGGIEGTKVRLRNIVIIRKCSALGGVRRAQYSAVCI